MNLVQDFVSWEYLGGDGKSLAGIPVGPSVADYATRLTNVQEVSALIIMPTINNKIRRMSSSN